MQSKFVLRNEHFVECLDNASFSNLLKKISEQFGKVEYFKENKDQLYIWVTPVKYSSTETV